MITLECVAGPGAGQVLEFSKPTIVLGRGDDCDICVDDSTCSRQHARIVEREGTYALTDLGSTNHTFVNSRQVRSVQLRDGDKIQVGGSVLKFVMLDDVEAKFHAEIRDLISYDQLTGLLTKESLFLALDRELKRCLSYGLPLGLLMMDLDRFKSVNDTHGHLMGSHVLAEVGRIIREGIRVEDVSARYGGEEFISYLAEADRAGVELAAQRLRGQIEASPFVLDDLSIHVTISIGVAVAPKHGKDIKTLVAVADQALYRAKETGRNRVCVAP